MMDLVPPDWTHCGHGADPATDPVGCRGVYVSGRTACLAHLTDEDRVTYLTGLAPGASVNHLGTTFDGPLLRDLLEALRDPATRQPRFGSAWFDGATFIGDARFDHVTFAEDAYFNRATFTGDARFGGATFTGDAWFDEARFAGAWSGATFYSAARFGGATFHGDAWFSGARFASLSQFGPFVCVREVGLSDAVFDAPVTMEIAAGAVRCARTRWASTATLRLRYAAVDLRDAVLSAPVAVTAYRVPFTLRPGQTVDESAVVASVPDASVQIDSVSGVDAAHLVLTDTSLIGCQFTGAFHLDELRLEGNNTFASPPKRWRWTRRRVLAEEHHWRALPPENPNPPRGWTPSPHVPGPAVVPGPNQLASVYRALRKASEDAKNEPDAADFYYGEMEMRRHDSGRSLGERGVLWLYWLLSGYGLRALRALSWLVFVMTLTVLGLMLWGLPADPHPPVEPITGTLGGGKKVALFTGTPIIGGVAPGPWSEKISTHRLDRAVRVAVNSVAFRSAGQGLTRPGTYIEMGSRLAEPILLVLVILAVRGRVKR
ncbi:pentapeptide repeat-containing protein [Streptomyces collinus]|uniref:pentapeptide repeat-containing protein n=1 Tax=Streptomyces collinus TaxID=42684 RepID=UPI003435D6CA